jgi:hypothetical protein
MRDFTQMANDNGYSVSKLPSESKGRGRMKVTIPIYHLNASPDSNGDTSAWENISETVIGDLKYKPSEVTSNYFANEGYSNKSITGHTLKNVWPVNCTGVVASPGDSSPLWAVWNSDMLTKKRYRFLDFTLQYLPMNTVNCGNLVINYGVNGMPLMLNSSTIIQDDNTQVLNIMRSCDSFSPRDICRGTEWKTNPMTMTMNGEPLGTSRTYNPMYDGPWFFWRYIPNVGSVSDGTQVGQLVLTFTYETDGRLVSKAIRTINQWIANDFNLNNGGGAVGNVNFPQANLYTSSQSSTKAASHLTTKAVTLGGPLKSHIMKTKKGGMVFGMDCKSLYDATFKTPQMKDMIKKQYGEIMANELEQGVEWSISGPKQEDTILGTTPNAFLARVTSPAGRYGPYPAEGSINITDGCRVEFYNAKGNGMVYGSGLSPGEFNVNIENAPGDAIPQMDTPVLEGYSNYTSWTALYKPFLTGYTKCSFKLFTHTSVPALSNKYHECYNGSYSAAGRDGNFAVFWVPKGNMVADSGLFVQKGMEINNFFLFPATFKDSTKPIAEQQETEKTPVLGANVEFNDEPIEYEEVEINGAEVPDGLRSLHRQSRMIDIPDGLKTAAMSDLRESYIKASREQEGNGKLIKNILRFAGTVVNEGIKFFAGDAMRSFGAIQASMKAPGVLGGLSKSNAADSGIVNNVNGVAQFIAKGTSRIHVYNTPPMDDISARYLQSFPSAAKFSTGELTGEASKAFMIKYSWSAKIAPNFTLGMSSPMQVIGENYKDEAGLEKTNHYTVQAIPEIGALTAQANAPFAYGNTKYGAELNPTATCDVLPVVCVSLFNVNDPTQRANALNNFVVMCNPDDGYQRVEFSKGQDQRWFPVQTKLENDAGKTSYVQMMFTHYCYSNTIQFKGEFYVPDKLPDANGNLVDVHDGTPFYVFVLADTVFRLEPKISWGDVTTLYETTPQGTQTYYNTRLISEDFDSVKPLRKAHSNNWGCFTMIAAGGNYGALYPSSNSSGFEYAGTVSGTGEEETITPEANEKNTMLITSTSYNLSYGPTGEVTVETN